MGEFLKLTRLSEKAGQIAHAPDMVQVLLDDHERVIRSLRTDIEKIAPLGDAGTEDFLTALLEEHEKMAWMLRSYLQ
jgi:starvation-inducible DNA-binding protein